MIYVSDVRTRFVMVGCVIALLLASGFSAVHPVHAANSETAAVPDRVADRSSDWIQQLGDVERRLTDSKALSAENRASLNGIVDKVYREAKAALERDEKIIRPLIKERSSLGPVPASDAPAEAPEVAALRKRLQDRFTRVDGRIQKARVIIVRAENLTTTISRQEAGQMQGLLLQRSPELLENETWRKTGAALSSLGKRVAAAPGAWWESEKSNWRPVWIGIVLLAWILAVALVVPARRFLGRRLIKREAAEEAPDQAQITIHAAQTALAKVIIPVVGLGVLAAAITAVAPSDVFLAAILVNLCLSGMFFFVIAGLARASLAPHDARWRLLPVTETGATSLNRLVGVIALYIALVYLLKWTAEFDTPPAPEFYAVMRLITNTGGAVLLLFLLPGRYWSENDSTSSRVTSILLRGILALALVSVPILDVAGYSALASYVLARLIFTIVSVGAVLLLRAAYQELLAGTLRPFLEGVLRLPEASARLVQFWLSLLTDIIIFGLLIYELLVFYGLPRDLLNLWLWRAMTGIQVGGVTISLTDIFVAIFVFIMGLTVTGWMRRWTAKTLISRTRMDIGVRESIATGLGYVGIIVSVVLAILAIGIDLSNLALIAGALSVGIGFGLKTVVENFAAGLLLLIERPIKAGDWIIASGREGIVRKISVRSTEVETFDRASVIVPNSELIALPVENWTHKNRTARLTVPVGVAYGSDTEKVREVLLACAAANEVVLNYPQSEVLFRAFGDSSLNFELRCFIPDALRRIAVSSELHFAVDAAFREAGIEIAFPQRDLHIRDANFDKPVEETGESIEDTGEDTELSSPPDTAPAPSASEGD